MSRSSAVVSYSIGPVQTQTFGPSGAASCGRLAAATDAIAVEASSPVRRARVEAGEREPVAARRHDAGRPRASTMRGSMPLDAVVEVGDPAGLAHLAVVDRCRCRPRPAAGRRRRPACAAAARMPSSYGSPRSILPSKASSSGGRIRLPTCVVRIRSTRSAPFVRRRCETLRDERPARVGDRRHLAALLPVRAQVAHAPEQVRHAGHAARLVRRRRSPAADGGVLPAARRGWRVACDQRVVCRRPPDLDRATGRGVHRLGDRRALVALHRGGARSGREHVDPALARGRAPARGARREASARCDAQPVRPRPRRSKNGRAASLDDLEELKAAYVRSALSAREAGADGVEVHAATGT